jgi:hypothetical protein
MTDAAAVRAFISKWEQNTQKESSAAKEHFVDLCHLLGVPTPNDKGSGPDTGNVAQNSSSHKSKYVSGWRP